MGGSFFCVSEQRKAKKRRFAKAMFQNVLHKKRCFRKQKKVLRKRGCYQRTNNGQLPVNTKGNHSNHSRQPQQRSHQPIITVQKRPHFQHPHRKIPPFLSEKRYFFMRFRFLQRESFPLQKPYLKRFLNHSMILSKKARIFAKMLFSGTSSVSYC